MPVSSSSTYSLVLVFTSFLMAFSWARVYGGYNQIQGGTPYDPPNYQTQNTYGGGGYGDVEMQNLINPPSSTPRDPNAILNECVEIERAIDSITNTNLVQLRSLQTRSIDDPDASPTTLTNREIDTLSSSTMALYRQLTTRIVAIKQTPTSADARNKPRVGMVDRKLKQVMLEFQQLEQGYRRKLGEQMARQYRIVNPDATEEEVRAAVEDTENNQVFSQALLQSSRRGQQSQSALGAVQARHEAIQKIERQIIELAQLFADVEAAVISHDDAVGDIESKTELIVEHVGKGNRELDGGIDAARSRNRKKKYCLVALVILVLIIVAIVVIISQTVMKK